MTIIKCKKCEHDIEIPSDANKCKQCGEPVIKSVNLAIKETKSESKAIMEERKAAGKTIKSLQKATKREIFENGKIVNRKLVEVKNKAAQQIKAMPADATKEVMMAIADQANKDQDAIFADGTQEAEAIMKKHTDEVAKIAESVGIAPPDYSLEVSRITKGDALAAKAVKSEKFIDFIQYGTFFLITPIGMLTIEEYFPIGFLLVLAGFLALPPLSKKITSTYDWLSRSSLMLMTHVIIVVTLYKFTTLIS